MQYTPAEQLTLAEKNAETGLNDTRGKYRRRVSDTGKYVILPGKSDGSSFSLFIRTDVFENALATYGNVLHVMSHNPHKLSKLTGTYVCVTSNFWIQDPQCLQLAEGLCIKNPHYMGEEEQMVVRDSRRPKLFGQSDRQNVTLSEQVPLELANYNANPHTGEAYVIVRKLPYADGQTPFHVAHVLFEDANSRITLEMDAASPDQHFAMFDMYSVSIPASTFHARYETGFTNRLGQPPVTIVLTKK